MATVKGMTPEEIIANIAETVTGGNVDGAGDLILSLKNGSVYNAGHVKGPTGNPGPQGLVGTRWGTTTAWLFAGVTNVPVSFPDGQPPRVNDLVVSTNSFGLGDVAKVTVVVDATHADVQYLYNIRGPAGTDIFPRTARFTNTTTYALTTAWSSLISMATTSLTFRANTMVRLYCMIPWRNSSTSWGGVYVEPVLTFTPASTASFTRSLGSTGFDNMVSGGEEIQSTVRDYLVDPVLEGMPTDKTYTVNVGFKFRTYDGAATINGDHDINNVSGAYTAVSSGNANQNYMTVILEEVWR